MDTFMNALIKMSLRGIVIILVVLFVRFLLKKLQIGHKYILGLWAMAFLYFIFPWKLSLPVGFWNNVGIQEEIRAISELRLTKDERDGEVRNTENIVNPAGIADNTMAGESAVIEDAAGTDTAAPVNNPAARSGVFALLSAYPRGIRQMSVSQPLGSLLAGINKLTTSTWRRLMGFIWLGLAFFSCICCIPILF